MALKNHGRSLDRLASIVLDGIRLVQSSALLGKTCMEFSESNTVSRQLLSFMDLPLELRTEIYELALDGSSLRTGVNDLSHHHSLVDPTNDPPPFFSAASAQDRRTAISLLLASKKINAEVIALLFSHRQFEFLNLKAARKLRTVVGTMRFDLIKNVEICSGWGDSDDPDSIVKLRKLVGQLPQLQSLRLLWFERGVKLSQGRRLTANWSGSQLGVMLAILSSNKNLRRVYHQKRYKQVRFCSFNLRKLRVESEIDLKYEIAAYKQRSIEQSKK